MVLDHLKQRLDNPLSLDLMTQPNLEITGAVEASTLDIDPAEYYL